MLDIVLWWENSSSKWSELSCWNVSLHILIVSGERSWDQTLSPGLRSGRIERSRHRLDVAHVRGHSLSRETRSWRSSKSWHILCDAAWRTCSATFVFSIFLPKVWFEELNMAKKFQNDVCIPHVFKGRDDFNSYGYFTRPFLHMAGSGVNVSCCDVLLPIFVMLKSTWASDLVFWIEGRPFRISASFFVFQHSSWFSPWRTRSKWKSLTLPQLVWTPSEWEKPKIRKGVSLSLSCMGAMVHGPQLSHGDAAAVATHDSWYASSQNFLLGTGTTIAKLLLFTPVGLEHGRSSIGGDPFQGVVAKHQLTERCWRLAGEVHLVRSGGLVFWMRGAQSSTMQFQWWHVLVLEGNFS